MTTTSKPSFSLLSLSLTFSRRREKPLLQASTPRSLSQLLRRGARWEALKSPKSPRPDLLISVLFSMATDDEKMNSLSSHTFFFFLFPSPSLTRLRSDVRPPQVLRVGDPHDHRGPLAVPRGLDLGLAQRRHDGEEEGCVERESRRRRRCCCICSSCALWHLFCSSFFFSRRARTRRRKKTWSRSGMNPNEF